jgi:hypothetical protein
MHAIKTLTLTLALTGLAATGGTAALADITAKDDRRGDAKCDDGPCPDLKSAISDHGIFNKTELFYIVTQHNRVQRARFPRIAINTNGPSSSKPEFYVEKRASGAGVFDAKTGSKAGPAVWRNTRRMSANWTFLPSAIGNPASYGWRVEVVERGEKVDSAPDKGYLTHRLR